MVRGSSGILPYQTKKIILSHLIENLADSQEQYQMAFIKCQYTDDYLLTFHCTIYMPVFSVLYNEILFRSSDIIV